MRNMLTSAALLAALATTAMAGGPNLATNGSFETPGPGFILLQGWENYGGNTFLETGVEVAAQDGTNSVKMFGEFTGAQNDQVLLQTVPGIQPGETYTLSAYAWHNSFDAVQPGVIPLLIMEFKDAGGANLDTAEAIAITPNSTPTDQWNLVEVSGIAPPNTTQIQIVVLLVQLADNQPAATGATFWDNVSLVQGGGDPCPSPADFNDDGVINVFDVFDFLNTYSKGC